jgi:hypothetical protein
VLSAAEEQGGTAAGATEEEREAAKRALQRQREVEVRRPLRPATLRPCCF